jgi:small subunit ribosomal protein S4e
MARGPKKHLKRIAAPKSWMLGKMGGIFATRPSQGPHKLRESIPLAVILKDKLKYALTGRECNVIMQDKEGSVKVDQKARRDPAFPAGIMGIFSNNKYFYLNKLCP